MNNPEPIYPQALMHGRLALRLAATALLLIGVATSVMAQSDDPATALDRASQREQALLEENQRLTEQKQSLTLTVETLQERQTRLDLERQQLIDERAELERKMAAATKQTPPFEIQWRATPEYPATAAAEGIEGFVDLQFSLAADGTISAIEVLESEPEAIFDQAAIDAVSEWLIDNHSGKPITLQKRIEFQID